MKKINKCIMANTRIIRACMVVVFCVSAGNLMAQSLSTKDTLAKKDTTVKRPSIAQDTTTAAPVVKKKSFTKNTFDGNYIIDNQTVMVPLKGTLEFDIQHRFGAVDHGFKDLFGLFASATMKLGFSYTPVNNLQVGFDATNEKMEVDWNLKYALLKQTRDNTLPFSVTLYGNAMMDTRAKDNTTLFVSTSDRFSYFYQLIVARKFSENFSLQIAPSLAHFNNLPGYLDAAGTVQQIYKNDNFLIATSARYKISEGSSIIVNYDQPITQNPANNPRPDISFGIEMRTSGHDFEIFFGNYSSLMPQNNVLFNQNNFRTGQFVLGFNISRLWNF